MHHSPRVRLADLIAILTTLNSFPPDLEGSNLFFTLIEEVLLIYRTASFLYKDFLQKPQEIFTKSRSQHKLR
jgi:hypothetical protein